MKTYLVERTDGGVSVTRLLNKKTRKGEPVLDGNGDFIYPDTIEQVIDKRVISDGKGGTIPFRKVLKSITEVDNTFEFPDRTLRNAWVLQGGKVVESLDKSQDLVREHRNNALEELDIAANREKRKPGGTSDAVDKDAQMLRDITADERFGRISGLKDLMAIVKSTKEKHAAKPPKRAIQLGD